MLLSLLSILDLYNWGSGVFVDENVQESAAKFSRAALIGWLEGEQNVNIFGFIWAFVIDIYWSFVLYRQFLKKITPRKKKYTWCMNFGSAMYSIMYELWVSYVFNMFYLWCWWIFATIIYFFNQWQSTCTILYIFQSYISFKVYKYSLLVMLTKI
jgi:hypothetical protein